MTPRVPPPLTLDASEVGAASQPVDREATTATSTAIRDALTDD
jgi:hypothetical protein